ncbi:hypothetical protein L3Q82_000829 [Scortum barcoo]|uniref:Uncharacterized protein n=1 Tax=Scortum barcoo TaxID=214431 RepID=A0ACB8WD63_9TELE|nr:hypothetical protein L3Q82_000829 [Scortum barcoo]
MAAGIVQMWLVDIMDIYTTPSPRGMMFAHSSTPFTETVTKIGSKVVIGDHGDLAALIGGIVAAALLLLICMLAVLMWCLSSHKGSYITNEMDDDDEDNDEDNINDNNDESVGSGTALQSQEPLKAKEDE